MIRQATAADLDALVTMGCRFLAETSYRNSMRICPDYLRTVARPFLETPERCAFLSEQNGSPTGMLLGWVYDHPLSGQKTASELCWWVNAEARKGGDGLRLLTAFERWAMHQGADVIQMMSPAGEPVSRIYDRRGYTVTETHYHKVLQ